jgi:antitoxin ParD1/3/4
MSRNTSITLGDHFASFISSQVQTGRYGSASDVVRAGLRLLEEHDGLAECLDCR